MLMRSADRPKIQVKVACDVIESVRLEISRFYDKVSQRLKLDIWAIS